MKISAEFTKKSFVVLMSSIGTWIGMSMDGKMETISVNMVDLNAKVAVLLSRVAYTDEMLKNLDERVKFLERMRKAE